jgi:YjbE family integral membrane protein
MLGLVQDSFWVQLPSIVLLDLLLAGDNALVIAMAVRLLPPREQRLGRLWGTFGAVALRIVFLALADRLFEVPLLRAAGGLLLFWVAWKLLSPKEHGPLPPAAAQATDPAAPAPGTRAGRSLVEAVRIIVLADVSMSLDNVLAVTGVAQGHLGTASLGIALSIPIVIWGSALLGRVMQHHAWIVWLGGGVLGHVAGTLLLEDDVVTRWIGEVGRPAWHPLSIGLGVAFAAYGFWASRRGGSDAPR